MPTRGPSSDLVRLLDASTRPVYALDRERRIVFANAACRAWWDDADLLGQVCSYHSQPDEQGHVPLAGLLCPPPEAFLGQTCSAMVDLSRPEESGRAWSMLFVPLTGMGSSEVSGVVAIGTAPAEGGNQPAVDDDADSRRLHACLQSFRARQRDRFQINRLVGETAAMRRVRAQVALAAGSQASVLIVGPPGSGRQHVARSIHYARPTESAGPLLPLACAALTAELLQASVRGLARTSPGQPTKTATLVLADADQMPPEAQAELAGLLHYGELPIRIVSTARQPLADLTGPGRFRADLACQLSTLVVEIPSLVERMDDLPLLAQAFVEQENARGGKQLSGFTSAALDSLAEYRWPGNVDELERTVAEAHARAEGSQIQPRDLPARLPLASEALRLRPAAEKTIVLETFLAEIERELVERAMRRARGNKTKAARLLGMTRPRLYRRLVQLGMEQPPGEAESWPADAAGP